MGSNVGNILELDNSNKNFRWIKAASRYCFWKRKNKKSVLGRVTGWLIIKLIWDSESEVGRGRVRARFSDDQNFKVDKKGLMIEQGKQLVYGGMVDGCYGYLIKRMYLVWCATTHTSCLGKWRWQWDSYKGIFNAINNVIGRDVDVVNGVE